MEVWEFQSSQGQGDLDQLQNRTEQRVKVSALHASNPIE